MTRRMSCSMTVDAVRNQTKTVTRRHVGSWKSLKPGDRLTLIEKGMGLAKGEKQVVLAQVEIVDVTVEPLSILDQQCRPTVTVDEQDIVDEGLGDSMTPREFVDWWARCHGYRSVSWSDPYGPFGPAQHLRTVGEPRGNSSGLATILCRRIEWRYLTECWICPNCRASFSQPLGADCADHQPEKVWV